jgi:hypothetical protein
LEVSRAKSSVDFQLNLVASLAAATFYFVQVYLYRVTVVDLKQTTPAHVSTCLFETMQCARRLLSSPYPNGQKLLDFPLFMVGIETADQIYIDWIQERLISPRLRATLSQTLSRQEQTGQRVSISILRSILQSQSVQRRIRHNI